MNLLLILLVIGMIRKALLFDLHLLLQPPTPEPISRSPPKMRTRYPYIGHTLIASMVIATYFFSI